MSSLSDKELAQAAAEAGISPGELKEALARRESGEVVEKEAKPGSTKTHGFVQARFATQPSQALSRAHRIFNQQVDYVATRSKDGQISYVNERMGFAYRLNSESDGTPMGALVRVDIDASQRMKQLRRGMLPMLGMLILFSFLSGGTSTVSYLFIALAVGITSFFQTRKQTVKFAKKTAQMALDRANQEALPGR